jgi:uncharacterized protein (DUF486 family)
MITLSVFAPFAVIYMGQPLKLDYLWPGSVCWARSTSRSEPEGLRGHHRSDR